MRRGAPVKVFVKLKRFCGQPCYVIARVTNTVLLHCGTDGHGQEIVYRVGDGLSEAQMLDVHTFYSVEVSHDSQ